MVTVILTEPGKPRHHMKATARTMEATGAASSDGDYVMISTR